MKPSTIITTALILNTSILFGQGFDLIANTLPLWALSALETTLIIAFLLNRILKVFSKAFEIDFGNLNVFTQNPTSTYNQVSHFESKKWEDNKNETAPDEAILVNN